MPIQLAFAYKLVQAYQDLKCRRRFSRLAEINKKRELDLKFQAKEREIGLALRVQQEMKLTTWLKTGTHPPLLWLPKSHSEDTKLLLEQRLTDVTAWRVHTSALGNVLLTQQFQHQG